MELYKLKESLITKKNIAYFSMGLAGLIMIIKNFFGENRKNISYDEKSKKRRKVTRKIKRLFDFKNENNPQLKFTSKEHKAIDNYSKLKDFAGNMVGKALKKEELNNPKSKQDYIFYQILSGMQQRFKQKTLMN
jgi:hypothetical protein